MLSQIGMQGLPALLGVDISGSMKIGIPGIGGASNELFGVYSGLYAKGLKAFNSLTRGELIRAIESASPAVVENIMRGVREGYKGATTPEGRPLISATGKPLKMTTLESVAQGLGFRPTRLSEESKIARTNKNILSYYANRKTDIQDRMRVGQNVTKKIQDYNNDAMKYGGAVPLITPRTLQSIMMRKPNKKMIILNQ
jgi:hypothetical protein